MCLLLPSHQLSALQRAPLTTSGTGGNLSKGVGELERKDQLDINRYQTCFKWSDGLKVGTGDLYGLPKLKIYFFWSLTPDFWSQYKFKNKMVVFLAIIPPEKDLTISDFPLMYSCQCFGWRLHFYILSTKTFCCDRRKNWWKK